MKLLTIAVPCYNSARYMRKCVESLLPGGDDVEIILVDDGSTDETGRIADEYQAAHPGIVRAIHQENGGHGEGVNQGMRNATGLYFKVVDSDDWADRAAYRRVLDKLREFSRMPRPVDMLVCNYVYEHAEDGTRHRVNYHRIIPRGRVCGWDDVGWFPPSKYLLMHSLFYRTALLRECALQLPKHTFFVDNLFAYEPLPYVKTLYYLDANFYRYFIGRADQSVNEKMIFRRIDQQIAVTQRVVTFPNLEALKTTNRRLYRYMVHFCSIMMTVPSMFLTIEGSAEALGKRDGLWRYLYDRNPRLYHRIRYLTPNVAFALPGRAGRAVDVAGYRITRKILKFN